MSATAPSPAGRIVPAGWAGGVPVHIRQVAAAPEAPPLLLLHGFGAFVEDSPLLSVPGLGVLAPDLPGFGKTPLHPLCRSVPDLALLCLDLLDRLGVDRFRLAGLSFGGWVAAELALLAGARVQALALVNPLGLKTGGPTETDILHIFNELPETVAAAEWRAPPDPAALPDHALRRHIAEREALCRYGWRPYMHRPGLEGWLPRIAAPTLVLRGARDGIASPRLARAYAAAIPGARFEEMPEAAHRPEIEDAAALSTRLRDFFLREV